MPREIFALTDATRDTLRDKTKPMASGWDKCTRYIDMILASDKTDPFAPFLLMYRGALRAGIATTHWDAELEHERLKYDRQTPVREAAACFKDKLRNHNETISRYLEYLADGKLDEDEIEELERLIALEMDSLSLVRQSLKFKKDAADGSRPLREVKK